MWAGVCWPKRNEADCMAVANFRCLWNPYQCLPNPPVCCYGIALLPYPHILHFVLLWHWYTRDGVECLGEFVESKCSVQVYSGTMSIVYGLLLSM